MGKRLSVQDSAERQRLLASQSTSELAASKGLQVPPVTASSVGAIGGTPQQQAMAGTPLQKQSAIAAATKVAAPTGETALEQAKTLRGPSVASAEDEAKKRKAAGIANAMGTFGDKATELVEGAFAGITKVAAKAEVADTNSIIANITDPSKKAQVTASLAKLADPALSPADRLTEEANLAALLNSTPDTILTKDQKTALYKSATATTAAVAGKTVAAAKGPDDKLTVSDIQMLGTSIEELSSLTGLSADAINNMSIADLQNVLNTAGQQQFGETQAVQAGMASGLLSSTERAALKDTLRSLEETGVAGAESQYTSLLKDIDEGTTVNIGGQSYSIEEILNEKTVTDILTDYFNDPNSKQSKLLAAEEPDLIKWANANSTGIKGLIAQSAGTSQQLKDIQTQAKAAFGTLGTAQAGLLADLTGIDLSKIQTSVPVKDANNQWTVTDKDGKTVTLPPSVQAVMNAPVNKQGLMSTNLQALSEAVGPEELKNYTPEQIAKLELDKINGKWATYATAVKEANTQANLTKPEDQLDAVAEGYDISDINNAVSNSSLYAALGFDTGNLNDFDTNKDGVFNSEDVTTLYNKQVAGSPKPSLDSILNGTYQPPAKMTLQAPKLSAGQQALAGAVSDGVLSPEEISAVSSSLSADEMLAAINNLSKSGTKSQYNTPSVLNPLRNAVNNKVNQEIESVTNTDIASIQNTVDELSYVMDPSFKNNKQAILATIIGPIGQPAPNVGAKQIALQATLTEAIKKAPSQVAKDRLTDLLSTVTGFIDTLRAAQNMALGRSNQSATAEDTYRAWRMNGNAP